LHPHKRKLNLTVKLLLPSQTEQEFRTRRKEMPRRMNTDTKPSDAASSESVAT